MEGGQDLICQQGEEERVVGAISPIRQAWSEIAVEVGTPRMLQLKAFQLTCVGDTNAASLSHPAPCQPRHKRRLITALFEYRAWVYIVVRAAGLAA